MRDEKLGETALRAGPAPCTVFEGTVVSQNPSVYATSEGVLAFPSYGKNCCVLGASGQEKVALSGSISSSRHRLPSFLCTPSPRSLPATPSRTAALYVKGKGVLNQRAFIRCFFPLTYQKPPICGDDMPATKSSKPTHTRSPSWPKFGL